MNSLMPCFEYYVMRCERNGFSPIAISGFGRTPGTSLILVTIPPASNTAFNSQTKKTFVIKIYRFKPKIGIKEKYHLRK